MLKHLYHIIISITCCLFLISNGLGISPVQGSLTFSYDGDTLYVGGDGPGNYTRIQDAIDNSSDGNTIFVYMGIYYEIVKINKQIKLVGEDPDSTVIDGKREGYAVNISANDVVLTGFTIQNGTYTGHMVNWVNIFVSSDSNIITNNVVQFSESGIWLKKSNNNVISMNHLHNNDIGIWLSNSSDNKIESNIIKNNSNKGINVGKSLNNTITKNLIINDGEIGIYLLNSCNNKIFLNEISDHNIGIFFTPLDGYDIIRDNEIYQNNFRNNSERDAIFTEGPLLSGRNFWRENYWNKPRAIPKIIIGAKPLLPIPTGTPFGPIWVMLPCIRVDWRPAQTPYDI